jgi:hypothetical protein
MKRSEEENREEKRDFSPQLFCNKVVAWALQEAAEKIKRENDVHLR